MFRVITAWSGKIDANSQNAYGWSGFRPYSDCSWRYQSRICWIYPASWWSSNQNRSRFWASNPLDVGALGRVIPLLEAHSDNPDVAAAVVKAKEQIHGRQVTMVSTLVSLGRGGPIKDFEAMLISAALREIYESEDIDWLNPPILQDLIDHIEQGSDDLRAKGRARTDEQWDARIDALVLSL